MHFFPYYTKGVHQNMNVFRRKDGLWCGKFRDVSTSKWRYVYSKDRREAQQALAQAPKL